MRDIFLVSVARKALFLSQVSVLGSVPHLYYMYFIGLKERILEDFHESHIPWLMTLQIWQVFIVAFLCSLCGIGWAEKYGLAGIGKLNILIKRSYNLFLCGVSISVISYLFLDKILIEFLPTCYPTDVFWAFAIILNSICFVEVIRFGMMSIVQRLVKKIWFSNLAVSIFLTIVAFRLPQFVNIDIEIFSLVTIIRCILVLIINLIYGHILYREGLIGAMFVHGVADLKFIAIALIY
jgi:hypothetical protein